MSDAFGPPSLVIYILSGEALLLSSALSKNWLDCCVWGVGEIRSIYFLVVYGFINLSSPVWWFLETESYCIAQASREFLILCLWPLSRRDPQLSTHSSFSYRMEVDF